MEITGWMALELILSSSSSNCNAYASSRILIQSGDWRFLLLFFIAIYKLYIREQHAQMLWAITHSSCPITPSYSLLTPSLQPQQQQQLAERLFTARLQARFSEISIFFAPPPFFFTIFNLYSFLLQL